MTEWNHTVQSRVAAGELLQDFVFILATVFMLVYLSCLHYLRTVNYLRTS